MKSKRNMRIKCGPFSKRLMCAAMCALLTLQPLSAAFALDASDDDIQRGSETAAEETAAMPPDQALDGSEAQDESGAENVASGTKSDTDNGKSKENEENGNENIDKNSGEAADEKIADDNGDKDDKISDETDPAANSAAAVLDTAAGDEGAGNDVQDDENENNENDEDKDKDDGDAEGDGEPEKLTVNYSWYICAGAGASSYTIADAASLKGFANLVNGADLPEGEQSVVIEDGTVRSATLSQTDFAGKTITLINDIDLAEIYGESDAGGDSGGSNDPDGASDGTPGAESGDDQSGAVSGWTPAGTDAAPFAGVFNGNGKSVKNIKVTDESLRSGSAAGLFGCVSGKIKDISVSGSVNISGSGSVNAGLLAGVLSGKAGNINADADISIVNGNAGVIAGLVYGMTGGGAAVADVRAEGSVAVADGAAGGVAGAAEQGPIIQRAACSAGVMAGAQGAAGGVTGRGAAGAVVKDSYNTGDISGGSAAGIVNGEADVIGCFNTGSVRGSAETYAIGANASNCFALEGCVPKTEAPAEPGGGSDDKGESASGAGDDNENESGVTFAPADAFSSGAVAWKLNTASGAEKNSETWTQSASHPELVSYGEAGPVYRLVMSAPDGVVLTAEYSDGGEVSDSAVGSEKAGDEISYYYIKGKNIQIKASAVRSGDAEDAGGEDPEGGADKDTGDEAPTANLAYAVIKDSLGRAAFSASTKSFAKDGLTLECSPADDSMRGEVVTYADAEPGTEIKLTFDANGGCFGGDADRKSDIMSIAYGTFMSEALYAQEDPEYADGPAEFTGWFMDSGCSVPADANAILAEDMTLYAGWIRQCEITFDLNGYGGDDDVSDWPLVITMYTGSPADSQTPPMWASTSNSDGTITRHNFLGWFTEPEGGEAWNFEMPVSESMTLYAHWEHVSADRPSSSDGVTSISGGESFQKLLGTIQDGMSYAGQTITFDEDIELDDAVVISSFDGILDGQGHTLKLNKKQFTSTGSNTALFRELKKGAEIRNLNITYDGGDVSSSAKFAALCDTNHGIVKNCSLKLSIRKSGSSDNFGGGLVRINAADGTVSGCSLASGSSIYFNGSFGGIAGENRGQISGCSVEQNVKISASGSAGGIAYRIAGEASGDPSGGGQTGGGEGKDDSAVGGADSGNDDNNNEESDKENAGAADDGDGSESGAPEESETGGSGQAAVKNCSVRADIVSDMNAKKSSAKHFAGGIAAEMEAGAGTVSVEKCFFEGSIQGKGAAGGIVGMMSGGAGDADGSDGASAKCLLEACRSEGNVSEAEAVGGIAGVIRSGRVVYCYSAASLRGDGGYLGGIAGAGGDSEISGIAADSGEAGQAVIETAYWFGSGFSGGGDGKTGMFCGSDAENVNVKNCYFGAPDDKIECDTDAHLSDEEAASSVKKASEFADGTVAWALETYNGAQRQHLQKFSMNAKPAGTGVKAASDSAGDGNGDDPYSFVRDEGNYSSPVLSQDSIYRIDVTFDESTDQDVVYDKTKDYASVTVGKMSVKSYGGDPGAGGDGAAMYMYGSGELTWREYSRDLDDALNALVNKLAIEENNDSYNVLNTYNVAINDLDGNALSEYKAQKLNRLGEWGSYKLSGYDLKIDVNVFKTITQQQELEPEEPKQDEPETKPSGGGSSHRHNSSGSGTGTGNGSQAGNTNGSGGNGTNEDANGANDGNGVTDSGAPARPEQAAPVISDSAEQISLTLPMDEQQPAEAETEQPDEQPETAEEAAPDSGGPEDQEQEKQDEPEDQQDQDTEPEQQPEQAQPQTVFEVIRKSAEENPASMAAAAAVVIVIIAAAAIRRIRRDR